MVAATSALLMVAGGAHALEKFSFSYSGYIGDPGFAVSGSGFLYGNALGDGSYQLTSGSGTSTEAGSLTLEQAGTYINTLSPSVNLTSDNLLYPVSNPTLDGNGIVFQGSSLPSDSQFFNIWGNGPGSYTYFNNYSGTGPTSSGPLNFSVKDLGAVPEPATWAMMLVGFGAVGLALRQRKFALAA